MIYKVYNRKNCQNFFSKRSFSVLLYATRNRRQLKTFRERREIHLLVTRKIEMTHRKPLLLAVLLCALTTLAFAQSKRPMTFEDMMAMKRLGETAVSPDGQWLAYSVSTVDLEANKSTSQWWLQKISGGEPQKITALQPGDSGLQWGLDNKQVLFESSRSDSQQIWLAAFDPSTGAIRNEKKLTSISTEADNARWSPDGKSIVFTSSVYPDCPAITFTDNSGDKSGAPADGSLSAGWKCNADRDKAAADSKVKAKIFTQLLYRHWNHYTGDKRSNLFQVLVDGGGIRDLTPNSTRDIPPFSLGGDGGFAFSPDSKELAFTENPDEVPAISTSAQIYTLDLTNPSAKPVKISTSAGGNFNPAYSPDGKYLAWRSQSRAGYESDRFRLMLYDRAARTIKDLLPGFDRWVDEFTWAAPGTLFVVSGDKGSSVLLAAKLDGKLKLVMAGGEYSNLHSLNEGRLLFSSKMSVNRPSEVVELHPDLEFFTEGATERCGDYGYKDVFCTKSEAAIVRNDVLEMDSVTQLNDTLLAQLDLPAMESFWFPSKDGTKVQGFLIPPPGYDPAKKYPVKFLIHGGPQGAWGDSWSYRWNAQLFAANGYVVVMINPRGSTGYGQAFVDGVNADWGGKPFQDLMTGLDYAEQHYPFIDKSRECALGASYGGYMANWILGHTNRFKCIVSHDGMYNAESAFGSTEELWFNSWEFKGAPWDYYGKPDSENPFRKWSPSLSARNFKTPTLVVHGQLDYRLDVSEGFQLFTALQLQHVPSKMLYFPDEGHWVLKPQNSRLWYKTVNDWVDQWTK
jgi:dipeptidyl aminopeptidase/acylaminoacyl peptidase